MFCGSTKWLVDNRLTELVENWKCLSFAYHRFSKDYFVFDYCELNFCLLVKNIIYVWTDNENGK